MVEKEKLVIVMCCRDLPISLDDSVLAIRRDIEAWFGEEISYLKRNKRSL